MTINVWTRTIGEASVLLTRRADMAGRPLPLVLWFHGFGVGKEVHETELARVASLGFLAAGVDAVGHGARRLPDLDARIAAPREEARATMLALAEATALEVPLLVRALASEGLADPTHVAVVGISMGGYLVYRALLVEPSIRAAIAILGSPEWPDDDSPHQHPELARRTALLSITAERDASVPPDAARRFHESITALGIGEERARYLELADAEHLMSAEQWSTAIDATMDWLARHLAQGAHRG